MKITRLLFNVLFLVLALPLWSLMVVLYLYTIILRPIVNFFRKKLQIKSYEWLRNLHKLFIDLIY